MTPPSSRLGAFFQPRFLVPFVAATLAGASAAWPLLPRYQALALVGFEPAGDSEPEVFAPGLLEHLNAELKPYPGSADARERLRRDLAVRVAGPQTLELAYVHNDPQLASELVNRLVNQLATGPSGGEGTAADSFDARLAEARRELERKEQEQRAYEERHTISPAQKAAIEATVAQLRQERLELDAALQPAQRSPGTDPVHAKALQEIDMRIAEAMKRFEQSGRSEEHAAALGAEAEAAKQRYLDLLSQRVSDRMANPPDQSSATAVSFRVVAPARLSARPLLPERIGFAVGGLLVGLFTGLVLVFSAKRRPAGPIRAERRGERSAASPAPVASSSYLEPSQAPPRDRAEPVTRPELAATPAPGPALVDLDANAVIPTGPPAAPPASSEASDLLAPGTLIWRPHRVGPSRTTRSIEAAAGPDDAAEAAERESLESPVEDVADIQASIPNRAEPLHGDDTSVPRVHVPPHARAPTALVSEQPPSPPPPRATTEAPPHVVPERAASEKAEPGAQAARGGRRLMPLAAALLTALAGGLVAWNSRRAGDPALADVVPRQARPGETVTLRGSAFDELLDRNAVHVGSASARVVSASPQRLEVALPRELGVPLPAALPVVVEVAGRRSNALTLAVVPSLRITQLQPSVARAGETVSATLEPADTLADSVHVAGEAAALIGSEPGVVRFRVPAVAEAARVPVEVGVAGTQAERAYLAVGRLPLVAEVTPPRGQVGDRVELRGLGFHADAAGNQVRFGDVEALVLSATPESLVVSVPPGAPLREGEAELPISVEALGATSSRATHYVLLRPPSGSFRPRFYAAPVPELPGPDHAFVSTELGAVMLLSGTGGERSTAERAARAARVLNELVGLGAKPMALTFTPDPTPGVTVAGGPHVIARVTPADVDGYGALWARMGRSGRPDPQTLAIFWTALLQDQLALFVQHERPTRVLELSARGRVLADLYAQSRAAGDGKGVPTGLVGGLRATLARAMGEMAMSVPRPGESNTGASMVGRWLGELEKADSGRQPIEVQFLLEGRRLAGSLGYVRQAPVTIGLRDVDYQQGALEFSLPADSDRLQFRGAVHEDAVVGLITGQDGRNVGSFNLRFAE